MGLPKGSVAKKALKMGVWLNIPLYIAFAIPYHEDALGTWQPLESLGTPPAIGGQTCQMYKSDVIGRIDKLWPIV